MPDFEPLRGAEDLVIHLGLEGAKPANNKYRASLVKEIGYKATRYPDAVVPLDKLHTIKRHLPLWTISPYTNEDHLYMLARRSANPQTIDRLDLKSHYDHRRLIAIGTDEITMMTRTLLTGSDVALIYNLEGNILMDQLRH